MRSGIRDVGITGASKVLTLFFGLAGLSMQGLCLGAAGRGSFTVCITFYTILSLLFVIGGGASSIYHVASKKHSISEGVANTWVYVLLGSLVGMAAGFALFRLPPQYMPQWLANFFHNADPRDFYLAMILMPIGSLSSTLILLLPALGDFAWFGLLSTLQGMLQLALYAALIWLAPLGVSGAMLAVILTNLIIIALVMLVLARKHNMRLVAPSLGKLREMLSYGLRYYVVTVSNQMNLQVGTVLLAIYAGEKEVGYFSVAAALTHYVMIIPETLHTALVPRVAVSEGGRTDLIAQSARVSAVVCGAILLLMAVLAKPLILALFLFKHDVVHDFLPAVGLLQILAAGVAVRCATKSFASYLTLTDRPGFASASILAGMLVNVGAMLAMLAAWPQEQTSAAAWSTTLNYAVSSIILYTGFAHFSKTKLWETWRPRWSDFG
jgi:O-antigen/teichoic acid export membrane protein